MKKQSLLLSLVFLFIANKVTAQVAINTDGSAPSDPSAMLEIKKGNKSKLKIRSLNFNDTAILELSNRDALNQGTDFFITARREQGLFFTTNSDLASNINDSLFIMRTNGNIGIGIINPTTRLDVRGNIRSTEDLIAGGSINAAGNITAAVNLRASTLAGTGVRNVKADATGNLTTSGLITSYVSISPHEFQKSPPSSPDVLSYTAGGDIGISFPAGSTASVIAPVSLPHGSTLVSVKLIYRDNSPNELIIAVNSTSQTTFGGLNLGSFISSGASAITQSSTFAIGTVINNNSNIYFVTIQPAAGDVWDGSLLYVKGVVFEIQQQ